MVKNIYEVLWGSFIKKDCFSLILGSFPDLQKGWKLHIRFMYPLLDIGCNRPPLDGESVMIPSHPICSSFR